MFVSVVNFTDGKLKDAEVLAALRAVNRQIAGDFAPYWSFGAELRLEGPVGKRPNKMSLAELRGDAILYLWDKIDVAGAEGYHDKNNRGIPYGFVFADLARELGEDWTVTLSHEALELVGDPQTNLLAQGPHPKELESRNPRLVYHWFEMCDAVQAETYVIDGVKVSNFVLPHYFTTGEQAGARNDFLATRHAGRSLPSFGINPGGYVGFFDPKSGQDEQVSRDKRGAARIKLKGDWGTGRGNLRQRRRAPRRC